MASGVANGLSGGNGTAASGAGAPEGAAGRGTGASGAGPAEAGKTVAAVLGEIPGSTPGTWLMSRSDEFKQSLIADLEWLAMPPILLRQFRLFHHGDQPVAAVLYARVSEEVARRLDAGAPTLRPQDWQSGETMRRRP